MPLQQATYHPPALWQNGHISTIYSALFRQVPNPGYQRERLELPDGDFLDLDWLPSWGETDKVALLVHGLEGDTRRPYMVGSAKLFSGEGYAVCAMNLRGCSGEPNRRYRSYHSGATEDLDEVIRHIRKVRPGHRIYLNGFSLGGNLILKYLGETGGAPAGIAAAAAISVPVDLYDSLRQLQQPKNWVYSTHFLRNLRGKLRQKKRLFPERITDALIRQVRTLKDFDDLYTSKAHGFRDALDYYARCSSLPVLPNIGVPTLILNAENDSFLGPACYPEAVCRMHPNLFFESPRHGGHVGFVLPGGAYYNEERTIRFFRDLT
ncbi:YheT family hydrolase [Robiginitalea sp. SC105]|uniref:YheT family hydrolase n=1 Tax=Robiginitalea sp. SC105 TaxID=2762332 RepID=UPI00163AAFA2|nr:alpha/beta fold hydrolase [Robiginitalea sp. SC105]MBC2838025.1 alpha/beta fold hydrolase [Robiginitalea sp. SC105]